MAPIVKKGKKNKKAETPVDTRNRVQQEVDAANIVQENEQQNRVDASNKAIEDRFIEQKSNVLGKFNSMIGELTRLKEAQRLEQENTNSSSIGLQERINALQAKVDKRDPTTGNLKAGEEEDHDMMEVPITSAGIVNKFDLGKGRVFGANKIPELDADGSGTNTIESTELPELPETETPEQTEEEKAKADFDAAQKAKGVNGNIKTDDSSSNPALYGALAAGGATLLDAFSKDKTKIIDNGDPTRRLLEADREKINAVDPKNIYNTQMLANEQAKSAALRGATTAAANRTAQTGGRGVGGSALAAGINASSGYGNTAAQFAQNSMGLADSYYKNLQSQTAQQQQNTSQRWDVDKAIETIDMGGSKYGQMVNNAINASTGGASLFDGISNLSKKKLGAEIDKKVKGGSVGSDDDGQGGTKEYVLDKNGNKIYKK